MYKEVTSADITQEEQKHYLWICSCVCCQCQIMFNQDQSDSAGTYIKGCVCVCVGPDVGLLRLWSCRSEGLDVWKGAEAQSLSYCVLDSWKAAITTQWAVVKVAVLLNPGFSKHSLRSTQSLWKKFFTFIVFFLPIYSSWKVERRLYQL